MKKVSLKECLHIYLRAEKALKKKKDSLSLEEQKIFATRLIKLRDAINDRNKSVASQEAKKVQSLLNKHFPLNRVQKIFYKSAMILVALFFAIIIRQTCFELQTIPSGSMRPTFRESDKLVVSKAQFGLNVPLMTKHFSFNPEEVKRMKPIVFSADGLDTPGVYTRYFYIFPGVKRFVKRTIGLPEDTLYFYGGKIYGIDKDGNDITAQLQQEMLSHIEHIPFIHINGRIQGINKKITHSTMDSITIEQNHIPIAHLEKKGNAMVGKMLVDGVDDIYELWGMGNYAMSRIVTSDSLYFSKKNVDLLIKHPSTKYFLELTHHSSIKNGQSIYDFRGLHRPDAGKSISYIPLSTKALENIWNHMYTARFHSKKGYLERFGEKYTTSRELRDRPKIKGRPKDGTYEFIDGIAYKVKWQNNPFGIIPSLSIPEELDSDHPIAKFSPEKCQTFYNSGMNQSIFASNNPHLGLAPSRYAYFRDGDLYLMGSKIFDKNSKEIKTFVEREYAAKEMDPSYTPFIDQGAPINKDGTIDQAKIQKYGMKIPKKKYYMLGDNHAQSADCREFGFVPEDNIQGVPSYMLWAPGKRLRSPLQDSYSWYTPFKAIAFILLLEGISIYYYLERRKFKKLKKSATNPAPRQTH